MSLSLILAAVFLYFLGIVGASLCYHRMLTHGAFKARQPLKILLVFIGLSAGTPVQWVGNHRQHHRAADTPDDPHSPYFGGLWHAHCGWYISSKNPFLCFLYAIAGPVRGLVDAWLRPRSNQDYVGLATDISKDPVFAFFSRPFVYTWMVTAQVILIASLFTYLWGWTGLFTYWATMVVIYNVGDAVDSLGHVWGSRMEGSRDQSRNNLILALLSGGDGWHANHHLKPSLARHGRNTQWDFSWIMILALERLGLVYDVKR